MQSKCTNTIFYPRKNNGFFGGGGGSTRGGLCSTSLTGITLVGAPRPKPYTQEGVISFIVGGLQLAGGAIKSCNFSHFFEQFGGSRLGRTEDPFFLVVRKKKNEMNVPHLTVSPSHS